MNLWEDTDHIQIIAGCFKNVCKMLRWSLEKAKALWSFPNGMRPVVGADLRPSFLWHRGNRLRQLEEIPLPFRGNCFDGHFIFLSWSHRHLLCRRFQSGSFLWCNSEPHRETSAWKPARAPISGVPVFPKYKKKEGGEGSGKEEEKGLTPALFCLVSLSCVFSELCSSCFLPVLPFPNQVTGTLTISPFKINLFLFSVWGFTYVYVCTTSTQRTTGLLELKLRMVFLPCGTRE